MRTPHTDTRHISTALSSRGQIAASLGKRCTVDTATIGHSDCTACDSVRITQFLAFGVSAIQSGTAAA